MSQRVLVPYRHQRKLAPYLDAIRSAGLEPLAQSVSEPISWGDSQGLVLLGGTDVNPQLYGAKADPRTEPPDNERDAAELKVIGEAFSRDLPILAICRGLQILNVCGGGTLVQHLPVSSRHDVESNNKGLPAHPVSIEPGSLLAEIAGTPSWEVNSRHHQAVDHVAPGLRIVARDPVDGTVEALEHPDKRFVLGVQWHPEDQVTQYVEQRQLFVRFAGAL